MKRRMLALCLSLLLLAPIVLLEEHSSASASISAENQSSTVQAQNNTPPAISILFPTNNTVFDVGPRYPVFLQLNYQTNGTISWVGYSIDGAGNVTVNETGNYIDDLEIPGYHNLTLYANDTEGNWATPQTVTWQTQYHTDLSYFPLISTLLFFVIIPLLFVLVVVVSIFLYRRHRKNKSTKATSP